MRVVRWYAVYRTCAAFSIRDCSFGYVHNFSGDLDFSFEKANLQGFRFGCILSSCSRKPQDIVESEKIVPQYSSKKVKDMFCPFCQNESIKVVDSRDVHEGRAIRRRRECLKCSRRFTTYEEIEVLRIVVEKRDGQREEYDREKIKRGIDRACEKRPISAEQIERMLADVEFCIHSKKRETVKSREIGKMILEKLREIDEVAYMRFASVYKSFGSARRFQEEAGKFIGDEKKKQPEN